MVKVKLYNIEGDLIFDGEFSNGNFVIKNEI